MPERTARVGELELAYETFGRPGDPAVLLVMGLGTQMIAWHEDLCREIAGRGFHVVRFDNRDVGRSSRIDSVRPPSVPNLLLRAKRVAAYTLDDMAADAAGLLDALGIGAAHVVGASMGGMIAQQMAVRHPDRVLSLVSIMSSTGHRRVGQPGISMYGVLLRRPPREREAFVEHMVGLFHTIGSPGFPADEDELRRAAGAAYDRGHDPAGTGRQLAAILASGDRTPLLRQIGVPTLVIHGAADRLVRPSGGRATAAAIPGARLVEVPGMGHDLPRGMWPTLVEGISENQRLAAHGRRADAA